MELKGKVIAITGGSSGIGKAAAKLLVQEGATLALLARDKGKLETARKEIIQEHAEVACLQVDVTKNDSIVNAVRTILEKFGKIDVWINGAGMLIQKDIFEVSEAEWDTIIDINLKGTFLCCKAVVESMMKRKQGMIINMASIAGQRGKSRSPAYACAKGGVITLSRYLYDTLSQHGIQVSVINPGRVYTPFFDSVEPKPKREQCMEPEDVAEVILQIIKMPPRAVLREMMLTSPTQD